MKMSFLVGWYSDKTLTPCKSMVSEMEKYFIELDNIQTFVTEKLGILTDREKLKKNPGIEFDNLICIINT